MTTITIEAIEEKQAELNVLISQFKATTQPVTIRVPGCTIKLRAGERYAGLVLNEDGEPSCHLVLLPGVGKKLTWQKAQEWAEEQGGLLPNRREQSLLFANCKSHLQAEWHWSSQEHEDNASYAWYCGFDYGHQYYLLKSYEGCAVAVRRLSI